VALDDGRPVITRAFAVVAVGLMGERTSLPFNEALRRDVNYLAIVPSLQEVFSIL
jgi:hypothetical protein